MSLSELFLLRIRFNEKGEGFLRNSLNGFLVFFDDDADALVPAPNGGSAVVADGEGSKLGSKFSKLVPVDDCGDILANKRFGDEASSRPFCFSSFFFSFRFPKRNGEVERWTIIMRIFQILIFSKMHSKCSMRKRSYYIYEVAMTSFKFQKVTERGAFHRKF